MIRLLILFRSQVGRDAQGPIDLIFIVKLQ